VGVVDDQGNPFQVLIAGTLTESVFQGRFIVDEKAFLERFPTSPGYSMFLAIPEQEPDAAIPELQRNLTDLGATVTTTAQRLAAFHSVENTYISIFNVLGGLGVILGAAGLGLVTARNLAERRDEFAMLHTIGIPNAITRGVVRKEVRTLILAALLIGLIAALVSILPSLPKQPAPGITLAWIAALALLTTVCASLSAWVACRSVGAS
ncbi:MAG: FtsX-like permease family protein, partial [Verrucomicrobiota bacterium]